MGHEEDSLNENRPSTSGTKELLNPTQDNVPKAGSESKSGSKEVNGLLTSSPQSFEIDDTGSYSELTPTSGKQKRRLKNFFGLWLDTSGENEDGAHKMSGSFAIISVFVITSVGLLTVKYFDGKLPVALQVRDIPNNPNR